MARANYVKYYLEQVTSDVREQPLLLTNTDINFQQLNDADYSIDLMQIRQVISNVVHVNKDPLLAFRLGESFSIKHLGLIGYALMSCDTVVNATRYWNHFNMLVGNVLSYPLCKVDNTYELAFTELCPLGDLLPFCIEQSLMSTLAIIKELTGLPSYYQRVEVTYSSQQASLDQKTYQKLLGCSIRFNCKHNKAVFADTNFNRPIITADEDALQFFEYHCRDVLQTLELKEGLGRKIRRIFLKHSRSPPKISKVANMLAMSERTLRRKLKKEGLSYSQILNDFRRDMSIEYLKNTKLSTKEIAYLLGYDDISSFRRTFKVWTGDTVKNYRQRLS